VGIGSAADAAGDGLPVLAPSPILRFSTKAGAGGNAREPDALLAGVASVAGVIGENTENSTSVDDCVFDGSIVNIRIALELRSISQSKIAQEGENVPSRSPSLPSRLSLPPSGMPNRFASGGRLRSSRRPREGTHAITMRNTSLSPTLSSWSTSQFGEHVGCGLLLHS
jgi:hypothetical protein